MDNKKFKLAMYINDRAIAEGLTRVCESTFTGEYETVIKPHTKKSVKLPVYTHRFTSFESIINQVLNVKDDNYKKDLMKFYSENLPESYKIDDHRPEITRSKLKKTLLVQAISRLGNDQIEECENCIYDYEQYLSKSRNDVQVIL